MPKVRHLKEELSIVPAGFLPLLAPHIACVVKNACLAEVCERDREQFEQERRTRPAACTLEQLRTGQGLSREQVAVRMSGARWHVLERERPGKDMLISSLRHQVEACGGALSVVVRMPGGVEQRLADFGLGREENPPEQKAPAMPPRLWPMLMSLPPSMREETMRRACEAARLRARMQDAYMIQDIAMQERDAGRPVVSRGFISLRSLRKNAGVSLQQLEKASGISMVSLRKMETGQTDPRISTVLRHLGGLGVECRLAASAPGQPERTLAGLAGAGVPPAEPPRLPEKDDLPALLARLTPAHQEEVLEDMLCFVHFRRAAHLGAPCSMRDLRKDKNYSRRHISQQSGINPDLVNRVESHPWTARTETLKRIFGAMSMRMFMIATLPGKEPVRLAEGQSPGAGAATPQYPGPRGPALDEEVNRLYLKLSGDARAQVRERISEAALLCADRKIDQASPAGFPAMTWQELRVSAGRTLKQVAEEGGLPIPTAYSFERRVPSPAISTAVRFVRGCGAAFNLVAVTKDGDIFTIADYMGPAAPSVYKKSQKKAPPGKP